MRWSETSGLEIVEVPNGPAKRAGLRAGHRIVAIDGEAIDERSLDEVLALLRGAVGSEVSLEVDDDPRPRTLTLRRAPYR